MRNEVMIIRGIELKKKGEMSNEIRGFQEKV